MKLFRFTLLACIIICLSGSLKAQEDQDTLVEGWNTSVSVGLDLAQLFQLNPKQGAGQNNFGFGGAIFGDAIYRKNRILWENGASWQVGLQKVGAGLIFIPPVSIGQEGRLEKVPYQKNIDELRIGSKLGYALDRKRKWYATGAFTLFTNTLRTYPGPPTYPGNFLRNIVDTLTNTAFFNPAFITLSVGIEFKPDEHWSFYYSPIGAKWIVVPDDQIAALGIHGNPVRGERDPVTGLFTDFDNVDRQFGSLFRAAYQNQFWKDRLFVRSSLLLYSNYLRNPQNIDVDWTNEISLEVFKGLKLTFLLNLFYDDDVLVQITDYDSPGGVSGLGKRISLTQQFLVNYKITF